MKSLTSLFLLFILSGNLFAEPVPKVQLYTEHIPPFQIVDKDNRLVGGIAHVVVDELMQHLKIKAQYTSLPWIRAYKLTQQEKNSLIYSIARSPQREELFEWIGKIKQVRYYFYGNPINSVDINLASKTVLDLSVVVVRGGVESDLLQQIGFKEGKQLFYADSYPAAFRMALKGRVDAVYTSQFSTLGLSKSLGLSSGALKPIYTLNQSLELYLAANKDSSPEFIAQLKAGFEELAKNGTIDRLISEEEKRIFQSKN